MYVYFSFINLYASDIADVGWTFVLAVEMRAKDCTFPTTNARMSQKSGKRMLAVYGQHLRVWKHGN